MKFVELTIARIREGFAKGEFSAEELAKETLREIEKRDPTLHAFLTVTPELALRQAREADERMRRGDEAPLLGVPCSVKDAILVKEVR
ncbi:MAG: amidase family protein, partial [bacterium]|nr:amidase family protein [bacterium]